MTRTLRLLGALLLCSLPLALGCSSEPPPHEEHPVETKKEKEVDPIFDKDPDMRGESADSQVAVRGDRDPRKRILFFNNFGRKHAGLIVDELKQDPDFSEFLPGGGKPNRVVVECKYSGDNLRVSVAKAVEAVGIPFHFKEADLAKHIEIYRTKD